MSKHSCPSPKSEHLTLDAALKATTHPNTVSLWLVPKNQNKFVERLSECMRDLASKTETRLFPPHVTLVPWIQWPTSEEAQEDLLWTCKKIVSEFVKSTSKSTLKIQVEGVEVPDASEAAFYRCLYFNVHQNPALIALHHISQSLLHQSNQGIVIPGALASPVSQFYPVLSLAYGKTSVEQRTELVEYVKANYNDLIEAAEGFESSELQVWQTGTSLKSSDSADATSEWKCLAKITLASGSEPERV